MEELFSHAPNIHRTNEIILTQPNISTTKMMMKNTERERHTWNFLVVSVVILEKIHRFDIHFSRCILLFDSLLAADNNDLLEYISVWSCCFHWLIFYFHLMRLGIEPHGKGAIVVVMHFHKWLLTIPLVPFIMAYSLCSCMFLFLNVKPMHCIYFTYGFFGSLISKYHTTVFFM